MSLVNLLFGFNGRINRLQYWVGSFGVGIAAAVLNALVVLGAQPATLASKEAAVQGASVYLLLLTLASLVSGWVATALQWKRFHDRGRPGWITFVPFLPVIMIVVSIIGHAVEGAPFGAMIAGVMPWIMLLLAIYLYFFIELGCLAGNEGPNKYGNPPGSGGGAPTPKPQAPRAPASAEPASVTSTLFGAQSAMERAIAEHKAAPAPAPMGPRPALAAAPAGGAPSFGRRPTR